MSTTLKEALYDNLLGTLSDNTNRRNQAEQQIKLLEVVNGGCFVCTTCYCLIYFMMQDFCLLQSSLSI